MLSVIFFSGLVRNEVINKILYILYIHTYVVHTYITCSCIHETIPHFSYTVLGICDLKYFNNNLRCLTVLVNKF